VSSRKSRVTGQLTDGSRVKKCDPLSYLTITASRRSEVARAIRQTASRKATGPDYVPAELFKAGETVLDRMHAWRSGKLVSGQRNGRSLHSSHFPRKVILNSVQITEQLLLSHMQARYFGSYYGVGQKSGATNS